MMFKPLTFHNGLMFFLFANISYKYFHVIMSRQRRHNIRNGIVWVQTSRSTCTCPDPLCVIEL